MILEMVPKQIFQREINDKVYILIDFSNFNIFYKILFFYKQLIYCNLK
jgi:hypothetical protein